MHSRTVADDIETPRPRRTSDTGPADATAGRRVFAGALATESNTFSPLPTGLASFDERGRYAAGRHPSEMSTFAGPLWLMRQRAPQLGWTLFEGLVASSQPGGITTQACYEALRDELLADIEAALPLDLVLLGLHGAMVARECDDCEGDLLARVRALVGPQAVVGAVLDPHNHLTAAMVRSADLLVAYREYPHTDILDAAVRLVDRCVAMLHGAPRPVPVVVDCRMLALIHTHREPGRSLVERLKAAERMPGVVSASLTHGFPWGDTADTGLRVLFYSDGSDRHRAVEAAALALAQDIVDMRERFAVEVLTMDEALALLPAPGERPLVIADTADNAGGGAASDATFLLRRLVDDAISPAALGPLWDPVAVRIAFEAGVGAELDLRLGGKTGPLSGPPLDLRWRVGALRRDLVMTGLSGTPAQMGDCALLCAHGVSVVASTRRQQGIHTDLFSQMGLDPATQRVVVVKSSQHFHAAFSAIASRIVYVATAGSVSPDFNQLPYRKLRRPMWPLTETDGARSACPVPQRLDWKNIR
jgi:microcystin degradation protein MlrC